MASRLIHRPLDRDFYHYCHPRVSLSWLPDDWREFRLELREQLPPSPTLSESDQRQIFQAGIAVREAWQILESNTDAESRERALKFLLGGTLVLLGHWTPRFPGRELTQGVLKELWRFLNEDLVELRERLAGSSNETLEQLRVHEDRVTFQDGFADGGISFDQAVVAGFLWWILLTEWCWDNIRMD